MHRGCSRLTALLVNLAAYREKKTIVGRATKANIKFKKVWCLLAVCKMVTVEVRKNEKEFSMMFCRDFVCKD